MNTRNTNYYFFFNIERPVKEKRQDLQIQYQLPLSLDGVDSMSASRVSPSGNYSAPQPLNSHYFYLAIDIILPANASCIVIISPLCSRDPLSTPKPNNPLNISLIHIGDSTRIPVLSQIPATMGWYVEQVDFMLRKTFHRSPCIVQKPYLRDRLSVPSHLGR